MRTRPAGGPVLRGSQTNHFPSGGSRVRAIERGDQFRLLVYWKALTLTPQRRWVLSLRGYPVRALGSPHSLREGHASKVLMSSQAWGLRVDHFWKGRSRSHARACLSLPKLPSSCESREGRKFLAAVGVGEANLFRY
eukprot:6204342-Pleurochrysis_carterae.AAC.8